MGNRNNSIDFFGEISLDNGDYLIEKEKNTNKNFLFDSYRNDYENGVFLIQGFFYEEIDKVNLNNKLIKGSISEIPIDLNGSYICVHFDSNKLSLEVFTDLYGYNKLYYAIQNKIIYLSSSLWRLTQKLNDKLTINNNAIAEHLILGHSLNNETIFNEISVIPPGYIVTFNSELNIGKRLYNHLFPKTSLNKKQLISEFYTLADRNFNYVTKKAESDHLGLSLTGGGDTRVILNAAMKTGYKVKTYTGYDMNSPVTLREKERTKLIASKLKLPHHLINMSHFSVDMMENVLSISDGYKNGHWMASLAIGANRFSNNMFYGFDADVLSGSAEISLKSTLSLEDLAFKTLQLKSYYKDTSVQEILSITNVPYDAFLERYHLTFSDYKDLPLIDAYFFQEKNVRSFRRIASFADGSKLGATPVNFFHDLNIIRFYRSLPEKFLKEEKFHHILGGYQNKVLSGIPSANNLPVPHSYIPILKTLFNNQLLKKAYIKLKKSNIGSEKITIKEISEINSIIESSFLLKPKSLDFVMSNLNSEMFLKLVRNRINKADFNTLISRLFEIDYIISKAKSNE